MTDTLKDPFRTLEGASVRTPDDLRGPAGRLESLYVPGAPGAAYAAIVCHPHPLFGGTMHNKVVYHAAKVFQKLGLPVLRFNFRGAGASEGTHDRGEGEQADLAAALAWLERQTGLPILAAGFSFGAWVALRTCCGASGSALPVAKPRVDGIIALGLPIEAGDRSYAYDFLAGCQVPKLFISGAADAFGPVAQVEAAVALAAAPAQLIFIPGVDHFFQPPAGAKGAPSGLETMQAGIRQWVQERFPAAAPRIREGVC